MIANLIAPVFIPVTVVKTYDDEDFRVHTLPLVAMGVVVAVTLALAMATSFGFFERQAVPDQIRAERGVASIDARSIQFYDSADGSIWVADGETGEELARFASGTGGFVRATARAMTHNRRAHGLGPAVPFQLIAWDDGTLTLRDTQTDRSVELASFGEGVDAVYHEILKKGR
ncbi:MAG: photosynthetic complex assembly protein PuhC [Pseudomonadota bacterium]|nr:photosynthetic complex assembly protein PuhC [Pseudomonadota bacterium]